MLSSRQARAATLFAATVAALTACGAQPDTSSAASTGSASATSTSTRSTTQEGARGALTVDETPWWQVPTSVTTSSTPTETTASDADDSSTSSSAPSSGADDPTPEPQLFVLSGAVLFEPDSPHLTDGAASQLGIVISQIPDPATAAITIDGFSDTGTGNSGVDGDQLSWDRANAVRDWFVDRGVPADHIATHGWGDTRPLFPSDTDEHRAANRRCEITVGRTATP